MKLRAAASCVAGAAILSTLTGAGQANATRPSSPVLSPNAVVAGGPRRGRARRADSLAGGGRRRHRRHRCRVARRRSGGDGAGAVHGVVRLLGLDRPRRVHCHELTARQKTRRPVSGRELASGAAFADTAHGDVPGGNFCQSTELARAGAGPDVKTGRIVREVPELERNKSGKGGSSIPCRSARTRSVQAISTVCAAGRDFTGERKKSR